MFEEPLVAGKTQFSVPEKRNNTRVLFTLKWAGLVMKPIIIFIWAGSFVSPVARFIRWKSNTPYAACIPEGMERSFVSTGWSKFNLYLNILNWVAVIICTFSCVLKAGPLFYSNVSGRCSSAIAEYQDKAKNESGQKRIDVFHDCLLKLLLPGFYSNPAN